MYVWMARDYATWPDTNPPPLSLYLSLPLSLSLQVNPFVGANDPFNWRKPIIPGRESCDLNTVAFPPNTISSDDITVVLKPLFSGILSFSVTWNQPRFVNGELIKYVFCIGEDPVSGPDGCEKPAECLYVKITQSSITVDTPCRELKVESTVGNLTADIDYHVERGTRELFLQVHVYMYLHY